MIENTRLPANLITIVGSESKDFAVKAGRAQPRKQSYALIIFGAFWTAFTSNLEPILFPALIIGLFVLIGIGMLSGGIYSLFKKGGYFVGTSTRLIHSYKGKIRSIDWEQFSGDIELSGDTLTGSISLQMRTGRMVSRKNGPDRYVPDVIYISKIPYVFEVEKICRRRIKENDPTPAKN